MSRKARWCGSRVGDFTLTLTLSLRERGQIERGLAFPTLYHGQIAHDPAFSPLPQREIEHGPTFPPLPQGEIEHGPAFLPLPQGEGRGEGDLLSARDIRKSGTQNARQIVCGQFNIQPALAA